MTDQADLEAAATAIRRRINAAVRAAIATLMRDRIDEDDA